MERKFSAGPCVLLLLVSEWTNAMSSVSSALTALASVSTMDVMKALIKTKRDDEFFLRFSKISTVVWAAALIVLAYISKKVEFVLNAAFALRGLTSGALLGGLILAIFWRKGRAFSVVSAMLVSLAVMAAIQFLPQSDSFKDFWKRTFRSDMMEIFWPWYTLIGVIVTLGTAWVLRAISADAKKDL